MNNVKNNVLEKQGEDIMYKDLAKYYDQIYSDAKDYREESEIIKDLVNEYKVNFGNALLDVGCGTGMHLKYLKDSFRCTGTDVNEQMLEVARRNVTDVGLVEADIVNMNLGVKFDVITCLFGAIGYTKTYQNLANTLKNFYSHLNSGGVVIIDGWFTEEQFHEGAVHMKNYESDELKISRVGYSTVRRNGGDAAISVLEEHYLIAEKGKGVSYYVDTSELAMFDADRFAESLKNVGFSSATILENALMNRNRYIAVKD